VTFLELPDDVFHHVHLSFSERQALDRVCRGEPLGQSARKTFNRAERKLELEQQRWERDMDRREREYQHGAQPGEDRQSSPSAASGAPARPPVAGLGPSGGGGASSPSSPTRFDGRTATAADVREMTRLLGLDPAVFSENRPSTPEQLRRERASSPSAAVVLAQRVATQKRNAALAARAKAAGGEFNAMADGVSVDAVRAQLAQLGVRDPLVTERFRPHGEPPKPPKPPPISKEQRAVNRENERLLAEAKACRAIDARKLVGEEAFKRFLELRGLRPSSSWAWERTPSRR
jgi:hypothetical protein